MPGHVIRQLDTVRKLIMGCQYLLLASISALAVLYALRLCVDRVVADLPLSDTVWKMLLFPATFLGCVLGTMVGRLIFKGLGAMTRSKFGLSRWFHPVFMFKDWVLLSLVIAGVYIAALPMLREQFPRLDIPAVTLRQWAEGRAPILAAIAFVSLLLLDLLRIIQPGAVLPRGAARIIGLPLLSGLVVAPTLLFHNLLASYVKGRPDLGGQLVLVWAALVASILLYAALMVLAWMINRYRLKAKLPVDVTLAMVGTREVGKTVFLTRAYTLLENYGYGGFALQPTDESKAVIRRYKGLLEEARAWPRGTVNASMIPFSLSEYGKPKINFSWIDLPGGVFEESGPSEKEDSTRFALPAMPAVPEQAGEDMYQAAREQFREQLKKANAVVMLFDAKQLMRVRTLEHYKHYSEHRGVVDEFYRLVDETEREDDTVAVTIIVAKSDMIKKKKEQKRIRDMMEPLVQYWIGSAAARKCRKPKVKVFFSSAISNVRYTVIDADKPQLPPASEPLQSSQCVETIFWTAAQVLREQPLIFDDAKVFLLGRSPLHQLAIELEDAAS